MGAALSGALGFGASEACSRANTQDLAATRPPAAPPAAPPAQTAPPPRRMLRLPPLAAGAENEFIFYTSRCPDATPFRVLLDRSDQGWDVNEIETFAFLSQTVSSAVRFYKCGLWLRIGEFSAPPDPIAPTTPVDIYNILDETGGAVALALIERDVSEEYVREVVAQPFVVSLLHSFLGKTAFPPMSRRVLYARVHVLGCDGSYTVYERCLPRPVYIETGG
jgi:hypothetical protein